MSGSDDFTGREFLGVDTQLGGRVHESRSSSPDHHMSVDSQNPDVVLDGGQDAAALLASKRRKVQESGNNISISKKRKDRPNRGMSAAKRGMSAAKALRTGLWSAAIGNKKVVRKKEKIAVTVAGFAMQAMDFIIWGDLKERLSPDDYETIWRSVFTSVVKFVLSIFDVEDFKRVYNMHKINAKHETLVLKLRNLKVCMDGTSFSYDKELKLLYTRWLVDQVQANKLNLCSSDMDTDADTGILKKWGYGHCGGHATGRQLSSSSSHSEKKLSEEDFCGLREGDVGLVLQGCEYGTRASAWTFNYFPFQVDDISEGELKLVLEEMEKFVPLKEEHKTQLSLEFLHKRSYHVLDALFVETWKGVEFKKVVQYLAPQKYNPDDPFACRIPDFVSAMQAGLFFLAIEKNSAFAHFQKAVTFPLSCDIGKFGEEVIKVVLIADHERRIQGRRFISLKHIMFGLTLSRVGEAVQKILNDRGLNKFTEKPPKMPIYFIYMLSSEAARSLGEDVVQLEHLALAIIYVKQENNTSLKNAAEKWAILARDHLECLKKANTRYGMISVKVDVIVNNLPQECYRGTRVKFDYSVTKLIHDFGAGLSFPAIRA